MTLIQIHEMPSVYLESVEQMTVMRERVIKAEMAEADYIEFTALERERVALSHVRRAATAELTYRRDYGYCSGVPITVQVTDDVLAELIETGCVVKQEIAVRAGKAPDAFAGDYEVQANVVSGFIRACEMILDGVSVISDEDDTEPIEPVDLDDALPLGDVGA